MLGELDNKWVVIMQHNESNDTGIGRLLQAQIKGTCSHLILSSDLHHSRLWAVFQKKSPTKLPNIASWELQVPFLRGFALQEPVFFSSAFHIQGCCAVGWWQSAECDRACC